MHDPDSQENFSAAECAWMQAALALAEEAERNGEVPVGSVIVLNDEIVGRGANAPVASHDPSAHAEIIAMRDAGRRLGNYRLNGCRLFVTLEPCMMCVGAIVHARIDEVIFAASDPKSGALGGIVNHNASAGLNHQFNVRGGLLGEAAGEQLKTFFRARRAGVDKQDNLQ